ncbi:MAG: hypothetical protein GY762_07300 [Proteobacteria bacterium]|nr:hypothetical protein [Pseudomonadota bacterium]
MRIYPEPFCAILFGVCSGHVAAADTETRRADGVVFRNEVRRANQGEFSCVQHLGHSIAQYGNLDREMVRKKMGQKGPIREFQV